MIVIVLAVLLALVVGGVVGWRLLTAKSDYERAVALLPESTLRVSYTDWRAVRAAGDAPAPGAGQGAVGAFLDKAFERDLSAASAIAESTYPLQELYGFSPLVVEWEVFGQGREGAVDVLQLADDADLGAIEDNLTDLGYAEPDSAGGVWEASADLVAGLDGALTPTQQNVVVLADERLVLMSDSPAYATTAADVVRGDGPSVASLDGVEDLLSASESPLNAVLWADDFACEDLSMGSADPADQEAADALVSEAGGVSPLAGLVMAQETDLRMTVRMHFADSDAASANLQPRVDLASGEAPAQGGTWPDRFTIASAEADGADVTLELKPKPGTTLLSELSRGPILFATC